MRVLSRIAASRAVLLDTCFVLLLCAVHVFALGIFSPTESGASWWPLLISVPATLTLFLRRHWPLVSYSVLLAVAIGFTLFGLPVGVINLGILVAIYSICVRSSLRMAVLVGVIAMIYPFSEIAILPWHQEIINVIGSSVNLILVIGWARAMRVARLRSAQLQQAVATLDQARDQLAADAAVVERARMAREFHDIVSHNLSVVALRAGVARALVDRNPEHARETLGELERTSSSALSEMRAMLGALRGDDSAGLGHAAPSGDQHGIAGEGAGEEGDRQPSPSLQRVDALIDSVRDAGVTWRLERHGTVRELGPGVEMAAYRVVQEAVTNVLKHGGPGHARVLLDYGDSALRVEITNHVAAADPASGKVPAQLSGAESSAQASGAGSSAQATGAGSSAQAIGAGDPAPGHGLIGLRERVALLGGTLTAHPVAGGFHLAAVLPCPDHADLA